MKKLILINSSIGKNTGAQAYFIPGNHDWLEGRSKGWRQVLNEYRYIQSLQLSNVHFAPENGCPGPTEIAVNDQISIVIMDTQWWLQQNERPGENSDCECKNEDEVISKLKDVLYRNRGKLVLFAAHHPFKTYGPHEVIILLSSIFFHLLISIKIYISPYLYRFDLPDIEECLKPARHEASRV
jgi:hypothetical protein